MLDEREGSAAMRSSHTGTLVVTALCAGLSAQAAFAAADEIVVTARALEGLRIRIELAENEVYARFNDINSNDLYDIHCYERFRPLSHIKARVWWRCG